MRFNKVHSRGFSLLEVMMVISFLGVIAAIAIPNYRASVEAAHATACLGERSLADKMIVFYLSENPAGSLTSLSQLESAGYLEEIPSCPYGGQYLLIPSEQNQGIPAVGCSLHFWSEDESGSTGSEPLTSLGSTFDEIIGAMIDLIKGYYDENGRYPRSWGGKAFSDIGLDQDEWENPVEGIVYSPKGKRIGITPADGYTFYVTKANGQQMELPASYNWSLWYSMSDGQWYFKNTNNRNQIDISTLSVVADQ
jgi:prepilin-type N-terminal cleavage/methylation domain-containing protein